MAHLAKLSLDFRDFVDDAGLGSMIWGRASYWIATYYHYIVAAFTVVILGLTLLGRTPLELLVTWIVLYLGYVVLRKIIFRQPRWEQQFYRPTPQFLRAQIGLVALTIIMIGAPGTQSTSLWVLYTLVILLASKHCSTPLMVCVVAESCAGLSLVYLVHGTPLSTLLLHLDLWADFFTLGLLAFVLHYLVRNLQARDATIAGYRAVNALARDVDPGSTLPQWQPVLSLLLEQVTGECASTWLIDPRSQSLHRVASVRRQGDRLVWIDPQGAPALSLDSDTLIASTVRGGGFGQADRPEAFTARADCPSIHKELAVPIDIGTPDHPLIIGALDVGLSATAFRKELLPDYHQFMTSLLNQARPMLLYTRRLEELTALQAASRAVWHSLDFTQVLDRILHGVVDTLGFEFATISLVDEERQIIRAARGLNVSQAWLDMAVHALDSDDIQACIVRDRRVEILVGPDSRFDQRIWRRFQHRNMTRLFLPIEIVDPAGCEKVIGTLEAGYRRAAPDAITPDQQRLLETFIAQVAMALAHADLLQHIQKKADTLTALHRVGHIISSTQQAPQVLHEVAQQACKLLGADMVMVYRYDREKNLVDVPAIAGETGRAARLSLNLNEDSPLSFLLNRASPYYSADARHDPLLHPRSDADLDRPGARKPTFIQWHNIKSLAGLPLVAQGEIVGLMFVNYRKRHQFDPDEQQVHELFAQQAAVAIRNAAVHERQRDLIVHDERYRLSRELHHWISQALYGIVLKARNAVDVPEAEVTELRATLEDIRDIAQHASNETGFIIDELRAPVDETRDFQKGLDEYAARIRRWYKREVVIERELHRALPPDCEPLLLSFACECIMNAAKHAQCRLIRVQCLSQDNRVEVRVCDSGIGFDPARVAQHKVGLKSLQELATEAGGRLCIDTAPGAGTTVSLVMILENDPEAP